jgi:hypothetical protein
MVVVDAMVVVDVMVAAADFMADFMVAPSDVAAVAAEAAVAAVAAAFLSAAVVAVVAVVSEAAAYRGASAVFADPRRALLGHRQARRSIRVYGVEKTAR